jgi:hypothetical protein
MLWDTFRGIVSNPKYGYTLTERGPAGTSYARYESGVIRNTTLDGESYYWATRFDVEEGRLVNYTRSVTEGGEPLSDWSLNERLGVVILQ